MIVINNDSDRATSDAIVNNNFNYYWHLITFRKITANENFDLNLKIFVYTICFMNISVDCCMYCLHQI